MIEFSPGIPSVYGWKDLAHLMKPATVKTWHAKGFRLYWRWKSRKGWQSPYIERFIGTLRAELLNHVIILNEQHLRRFLADFVEKYYHIGRPHQGLKRETPLPQKAPLPFRRPSRLISIPVVGGLHHRYLRVAA